MNNKTIKLSDGSEFEFLSDKDLNLGLIKKIAELSDSDLYSLVSDAGMKYEGKPSQAKQDRSNHESRRNRHGST